MLLYSTRKDHPVNWDEAAAVFERAPLGRGGFLPGKLRKSFERSYAVVYAFYSERLIGLGRAVSDGEHEAMIYDVALLPEYQRNGIGREMVERLCAQLPVSLVSLYAGQHLEGFYEKCGFVKLRTLSLPSRKWLSRMNRIMGQGGPDVFQPCPAFDMCRDPDNFV